VTERAQHVQYILGHEISPILTAATYLLFDGGKGLPLDEGAVINSVTNSEI